LILALDAQAPNFVCAYINVIKLFLNKLKLRNSDYATGTQWYYFCTCKYEEHTQLGMWINRPPNEENRITASSSSLSQLNLTCGSKKHLVDTRMSHREVIGGNHVKDTHIADFFADMEACNTGSFC